MRRVPNVDKLHRLTGFRPQTPLNEIVDRVTTFFREKNQKPEVVRLASTNAV
jgi:nucleoside-diphosphate-sugar epimerase